MVIKSIFLLAFAVVSIQANAPFNPCKKHDVKCLQGATESFMSQTYGGNADYGILRVDPFTIASKEFIACKGMGLKFYFSNLEITGLKNLKINDFTMDTDKKSVVLKIKADVTIASNFKVGLMKAGKTFEDGTYKTTATILATTQYGYSLKDVNGTEHFDVGPEKSTFEFIGEPIVTLGGPLVNTLSTDEDAIALKSHWETKKSAIRKKTVIEIVKPSFAAVINNLRTAAKLFPKSAFFEDM